MLKIVVDTNIWIRSLLGGPVTLPVLEAWRTRRFEVQVSDYLLRELEEVCARPRLAARIPAADSRALLDLLRTVATRIEPASTPPRCRDPKDDPILATAIDAQADAIVSGDADLRADDQLRREMAAHGVELWGVETLLKRLDEE